MVEVGAEVSTVEAEVSTVEVAAFTVAVHILAAVVASMADMVAITAADTVTAVATARRAEAQAADSVRAEVGVRDVLMARDRGARELTPLRFATDSFIPSEATVASAE